MTKFCLKNWKIFILFQCKYHIIVVIKVWITGSANYDFRFIRTKKTFQSLSWERACAHGYLGHCVCVCVRACARVWANQRERLNEINSYQLYKMIVFINRTATDNLEIYWTTSWGFRGLTGGTVGHRTLPSGFKPWCSSVWREFHLSLPH